MELAHPDLIRLLHPESQPQREGELPAPDPARDVLDRNAGCFEPCHQTNYVYLGRVESPVVVGLQDLELDQPLNLVERARNEAGQFFRRDGVHRLFNASTEGAVPTAQSQRAIRPSWIQHMKARRA